MKRFIIIIFFIYSFLNADCLYNGILYKEGTIIGPYKCIGNAWVKK